MYVHDKATQMSCSGVGCRRACSFGFAQGIDVRALAGVSMLTVVVRAVRPDNEMGLLVWIIVLDYLLHEVFVYVFSPQRKCSFGVGAHCCVLLPCGVL